MVIGYEQLKFKAAEGLFVWVLRLR